jgi:hypothetical protein
MSERRRYVRVPGENQVVVTLLSTPGVDKPARKRIHGITTDISVTGTHLTLVTDDPLPVGAVAEVEMTVTDPNAVFVHEVDVRWTRREPGILSCATGVSFRQTKKPSPQTWVHYVENQTLGCLQD